MEQYYYGSCCLLKNGSIKDKYSTLTGNNVVIGVLDSGCASSMIVDSRIKKGKSFIVGKGDCLCEENSNVVDSIGHGTLCIDRILSIAPGVSILPVKIFDSDLNTSPSILIKAIEYAINSGVNIINISASTILESAIKPLYYLAKMAHDKNIVIVASSPNSNPYGYPASFDNVISVGSYHFYKDYLYYYNEGEYCECLTNGDANDNICELTKCQYKTGNSYAAATIAGVIALFIEKQPESCINDIRKLLKIYSSTKMPKGMKI